VLGKDRRKERVSRPGMDAADLKVESNGLELGLMGELCKPAL
jgi:hypothetical protein